MRRSGRRHLTIDDVCVCNHVSIHVSMCQRGTLRVGGWEVRGGVEHLLQLIDLNLHVLQLCDGCINVALEKMPFTQ